ncbi:Neuroendocrine convertase 1 [Halotydeus destructor]|nr:Neuroendocrine convertase 1 [Halotydeus destructor]
MVDLNQADRDASQVRLDNEPFKEDRDEDKKSTLHVDEQSELENGQHFTSEWVVRVNLGQENADRVAKENGYQVVSQLTSFPNTYIFARKNLPRRMKRHLANLTEQLTSDHRVEWAEQQLIRPRDKRGRAVFSSSRIFVPDPMGRGHQKAITFRDQRFNDELWLYQWYLVNSENLPSLPNIGLRVSEAWDMGYTGKGVVVSVLDDGIEHNHTDLAQNYDPRASFDTNDNDADPFPAYDKQNTNSHGTKCAGEIAMAANNKKCGVGVAYNARIGGIRCIDGQISDAVESAALAYNIDYIDIYSASWGPKDNGRVVDGPKRLAIEAMEKGVTQGRQGKGVIYVWASGNGGISGDNCNCDGYVSSIYTLAIGSSSQHGRFPWYGERCASTMAVAYSSGTYTDQKIATTDLHNKCTVEHTGTSAAAPLATGIIALLLEANGNLTWRDVQHLVVYTSNFRPLSDNKGWKRNGQGLMYSSRFGFGLLDAAELVKSSLKWTNVPAKTSCLTRISKNSKLPAKVSSGPPSFVSFHSTGCKNSPNEVNSLEHVAILLDMEYPKRGFLDIYLKSPSGSVSMLLSRRPNDDSADGFRNWTLTTVHFWGERPHGKWLLMLRDKNGQHHDGRVKNATLILHGTRTVPSHFKRYKVYKDEEIIARVIDQFEEYDEDDMYDQNSMDNNLAPLIPSSSQLVNWNDYGLSLIPLSRLN